MYETKNVWNVQFKDMLKFYIPKMRLVPAKKGLNISNLGKKKRKCYFTQLKDCKNCMKQKCPKCQFRMSFYILDIKKIKIKKK